MERKLIGGKTKIKSHNLQIVHELITEEDLVVMDSMSIDWWKEYKMYLYQYNRYFKRKKVFLLRKMESLRNVASNFPQYPEIKRWYTSEMIPCYLLCPLIKLKKRIET